MTQKKIFRYPLAITGDFDSLIPQLKELGYVITHDPGVRRLMLVTNVDDNKIGESAVLSYESFAKYYNRTKVSADNRDLVLALAAAVEEEEGQKGEYYVFFDSYTTFTTGKLYQQQTKRFEDSYAFVDDEGTPNGFSGNNFEHFRKATKEEIIAHFSKPILTAEDLESAGAHDIDFSQFKSNSIVSESPEPVTVPVAIDFVQALHDVVNDELQERIEKEFPTLFKQRPTFKSGDRLVFFPACQELIIVAAKDTSSSEAEIGLADPFTGLIQSEPVYVDDINRISERELIAAGEAIGLNRYNYAKYSN